MTPKTKKLGTSTEFNALLGWFHSTWLATELSIDYLIFKQLRISRPQAHHLLAGMEVGRKMRLLDGLLQRSDMQQRAVLIGFLRKIQNESLRNVFAHSLLWSDEHSVTFLNRSFGQRYEAKEHRFTLIRFRMHVTDFIKTCVDFYNAAEIDYAEVQAFARAAMRASRSSRKSPKPPRAKA